MRLAGQKTNRKRKKKSCIRKLCFIENDKKRKKRLCVEETHGRLFFASGEENRVSQGSVINFSRIFRKKMI